MGVSAKVVCDSSFGNTRLITLEVEFHRFILPEVNTHRSLSRNYQSSRAVPVKQMIEQVRNNPAMPVRFGKNKSGMQDDGQHREPVVFSEIFDGVGEITNFKTTPEFAWKISADNAARMAEAFHKAGYAKQVVNRILEPFMWTKGVITGTYDAWQAFLKLRAHCYSEDTEVLTTSGWKLIKDVKNGETVVSLNPETKKLEDALVVDTVKWRSDGTAVKFSGASVDVLVSDLHKMVVIEGNSVSFAPASSLIGTNPIMIKNCIPDEFDSNSLDYKRGKFLGFYLGNGWKYKAEVSGNSGVVVCKGGKYGHNVVSELFVVAQELFPDKSVTVYEKGGVYHCKVDGKSVYEQFKEFGNATEKDIPNWVWEESASLKRGVFDGMLLADSNILQQSGGLKFYTSSRKMADSFQRLCLEVGVSGTIAEDNRVGNVSSGVDSQGNPFNIETKNIGYRVSVNMYRNTPKLKATPKEVPYEGDFACISLDKNHTLYVRRNGKAVWSGNCDAQPEIQALAFKIRDAIEDSVPTELKEGEWHLPYVQTKTDFSGNKFYTTSSDELVEDEDILTLEEAIKISTSCTAQTSYRKLDDSLEKALKIYDMLNLPENGVYPEDPPHFSPTEHIAMAKNIGNSWFSGNFYNLNFIQYRKLLERGIEKEVIQ